MSLIKSILMTLCYLSGFFNLLIFMFHKEVYNLKRSNNELSIWTVIIQIFKDGGIYDSFVISKMHILSNNITDSMTEPAEEFEHQSEPFDYENINNSIVRRPLLAAITDDAAGYFTHIRRMSQGYNNTGIQSVRSSASPSACEGAVGERSISHSYFSYDCDTLGDTSNLSDSKAQLHGYGTIQQEDESMISFSPTSYYLEEMSR